jgi:uncharacterized protein (TIGR00661 family)
LRIFAPLPATNLQEEIEVENVARILFGVMGDALGHVSQALAVAQEMPQHDFLFLGGGNVFSLKALGYSVEPIPMFATRYSNNRVNVAATVGNALRVFLESGRTIRKVVEIARAFDPDLILTAYEYFVPSAAKRLGKACISIDNQHFLTKCACTHPKKQVLSRLMFTFPLRFMYGKSHKYFINTFFRLPPTDPQKTEVFPPLLRREVRSLTSNAGDHVLVYQTSSTFFRLPQILEGTPGRVIVYGLGNRAAHKNIIYKRPSWEDFLKDLASCRYVITNGGHNVISEALYFGKPVLSFPIHLAYEQCFNAHMLATMGYGDYSLDPCPDLSILDNFEKRLAGFRSKIAHGDFLGNGQMANRLEQEIQSL